MPEKISATLALQALADASAYVNVKRDELTAALALRDEMIRDCRDARIPFRTISSKTGLGRDRLMNIAHSAG